MNERNIPKPLTIWLAGVLSLAACVAMEPASEGQRTLGNLVVQGVPEIPGALVARMQQ